jgi:transposase
MTQRAVGRVAMRAHMILLSARGHSAYDIAELHAVTDPTVYKWIERFDTEGPGGLYDREREGRPPEIGEEAEDELRRLLEHPPTEEGYDFTRWTTPRLAEHLKRELGVDVHPETVRQALRRLDFRWKRPRRSLPEDPAYAERIAEIDRTLAEVGPETTVLFEDETDLRRFPPIRNAWMPLGEQRRVAVPEGNGKFALYGVLDPLTGATITAPYPQGQSEHTKSFLRKVLGEVEGRIVLIWDQAGWHTSKAVEALIDEHERLEVLLLPKRSPQDNPIEDLWRVLKNQVAANLERSLATLKAACRKFFDALTPERALEMAGLS